MTTPPTLDQLGECLKYGQHKIAVELTWRWPFRLWICDDGRQVLVDRDLKPIWQCDRDGVVGVVDPDEFLDVIDTEILFLDNDELPPYRQYPQMKRLRALLVDWGVIQDWRALQRKRWERIMKLRAERERRASR